MKSKATLKNKVFSVTLDDCEVQTFRAGGKGGQGQNKTNSGVRIKHLPSGAIGESRESRHQLQNKKLAFERMARSKEFQVWAKMKALKTRSIDEIVDEQMQSHNLKIEYF